MHPIHNRVVREPDEAPVRTVGHVEILLDWHSSIPAVRERLDLVLAETDLRDGEVARVHVTDIATDAVRVRVLLSAKDAPTLWELHCHVREDLASWVRTDDPEWTPRQRVRIDPAPDANPAEPG